MVKHEHSTGKNHKNDQADQVLPVNASDPAPLAAPESTAAAGAAAEIFRSAEAKTPATEVSPSAVAELAVKDARIKVLEEEVSSLKDQYLRKLADYENFRKRIFREKDDAVQFANAQLLIDLVVVMDDFDRAVLSSETSRDFQSLHDGVDMIRKGLLGMLQSRYGLQRFDSLNTPFDPNLHEAMLSEPGDCAEPLVVEEYCKGYKLKERVLRGAKVKVRMPAPEAAAGGGDQPGLAEEAAEV
ncbi:MAG: nucleotide exchange factor GrpE [Spirochaetes bacterium GWD1_61_31]|nr:MAG: nucleotide exchange factor GrpE [Spirochaetes bacterium GWB1_60_80]OHD33474.1 MAG: nucleotide exchange factor GrpE [Spirochaetes bacterium GWC1_61_12]OHD34761.1 MAG: nucleotide exchange factor GrpE [Spirochaetes bacterium GWD1_61_31]OHD45469.1 MAG: nucleotide exchange factor GrpE [Spirochaetes bacterium GWE1_60_18]OHD58041.1 MAG: nucleotide exchange factor GrpE [Spirochaetes bacterium GWF1_60_12]HAP44605.1 nucleotide exchange factor GrpE [Spirochaetaceae bacterium]